MVLRLRAGAPPSNTKTGLMPWKRSLLMRRRKPRTCALTSVRPSLSFIVAWNWKDDRAARGQSRGAHAAWPAAQARATDTGDAPGRARSCRWAGSSQREFQRPAFLTKGTYDESMASRLPSSVSILAEKEEVKAYCISYVTRLCGGWPDWPIDRSPGRT
jgi:hypothetical protein